MTNQNDPWTQGYKIPWDDPDFSRRMLEEHLTQDHDLASRRVGWIEKQVAWIHEELLSENLGKILDLGCGPGFYSHRLAKIGHACDGIDFGPASIKYALENNPAPSRSTFTHGDIRHVSFGGPYDLAMLLYGEMNVFSPEEILAILNKAQASLRSGGILAIEVQAEDAVERAGVTSPSEYQQESGLFSDLPHSCRTENQWLAGQKVAIQTFTVTETPNAKPRIYRNTTKAWSDRDLVELLTDAGFCNVMRRDDWPCNTEDLKLWVAVKA